MARRNVQKRKAELEGLRALLEVADLVARHGKSPRFTTGGRKLARTPDVGFTVEAHRSRNHLTLALRGFVAGTRAGEFAAEVERALERLRPGFSSIFDLSEVEMVRPDAGPALRSVATALAAAGLERMVQVQGTPGARVVARFVEGPYQTRAATSLEEAEAFLRRRPRATRARKPRPPR